MTKTDDGAARLVVTRGQILLLVAIVGILSTVVTAGISWGSFQATANVHYADRDLHHTYADLDERYILRQVSDERYMRLTAQLDRLDNKLDKLLQEQKP